MAGRMVLIIRNMSNKTPCSNSPDSKLVVNDNLFPAKKTLFLSDNIKEEKEK
jgi:hypothetical protein